MQKKKKKSQYRRISGDKYWILDLDSKPVCSINVLLLLASEINPARLESYGGHSLWSQGRWVLSVVAKLIKHKPASAREHISYT